MLDTLVHRMQSLATPTQIGKLAALFGAFVAVFRYLGMKLPP